MPRAKLSNVSLKQLVAELSRRQVRLASLVAQRDEVNRQIAELEALQGLEPAAKAKANGLGRKPGRKPGRKAKVGRAAGRPLAEYVKGVLARAGKGLKVKEIEAKVLSAGYPTKAATIYNPVMKVLANGFKKVSRGVYALKAGVAAAAKAAVAASPKSAPKAKRGRRRGQFSMTAEQFVLGLVKGAGATTAQVNEKWKAAGRAGTANVTLTRLYKTGKIKRAKLKAGKGSTYTVA